MNFLSSIVEAVVIPPANSATAFVDFIGDAQYMRATNTNISHCKTITLKILIINQANSCHVMKLRNDVIFFRFGLWRITTQVILSILTLA